MKNSNLTIHLLIAIVLLCIITLKVNAGDTSKLKAQSFSYDEVRLLDSPFKKAMELNSSFLLQIEPDRLLSWFRKEAGLEPKAKQYGGWESEGLAGHSLGHYLSACAITYASTGNKQFFDKVNYIIDELEICQNKIGTGYFAAIPNGEKVFKEVAEGKIDTKNFSLNGLWSPWYTLHKQIAGLLDAHKYCRNEKALNIAIKFAEWADNLSSKLNDEQWQKMLACEHGGMNESLAELYSRTGNIKHLNLAKRFYHNDVLNPLSEKKDILQGLHSNTQIPKLIGLARLYEITSEERYKTASEFFWDRVVHHHSYVIGGNSCYEYFGEPDKLNKRLTENTCETCNTYNMLKLTEHLFSWNPEANYMDYYERALYNHILASQNPMDGMTCYFVPLKPGSYKTYSDTENSFWCCTGTGMENHSKYNEAIYFHNTDELWINLFIASELNWKEKGFKLIQKTNFPEDNKMEFVINCSQKVNLNLNIRYPYWAQNGIAILVNGAAQKVTSTPGSYICIKNSWKNGDKIVVTIPMTIRTEALPDNPDKQAILYGPILLAGELGEEKDLLVGEFGRLPVFINNNKPLSDFISPVENENLTFKTNNLGDPRDVVLYPFYKMHNKRYSVYWDTFTNEEWTKLKSEHDAELERQKQLDEITIDFVQPGDSLSEKTHNQKGENSRTGESWGGKWRVADNGWFSYDLKILPEKTCNLICTYWGNEKNRNFDILVDGEKIATQSLNTNKPDEFFNMVYELPKKLTEGKEKITITFKSNKESIAGGLYGLRIISSDL